jgi:hypothetical protein
METPPTKMSFFGFLAAKFHLVLAGVFLVESLWCLLATWFSAHGVIDPNYDETSYLLCIVAMLFTATFKCGDCEFVCR